MLKESNITPREREVIQYLTRGLTSNEIASVMYLSHHTIISHRKNILEKLGANNSIQLGILLERKGLTRTKL